MAQSFERAYSFERADSFDRSESLDRLIVLNELIVFERLRVFERPIVLTEQINSILVKSDSDGRLVGTDCLPPRDATIKINYHQN